MADNLAVFSMAEGGSVFLGATPETLVQVQNGVMRSHALAGTAATASAALADKKLRIEHGCVVEQMVSDLRGMMRDLHVGDAPQARRAGPLVHLETEITGTLAEDVSLLHLVDALHPTPALGGVPRTASLEWLRAHESLDRGFYGGPVGWISPNGDGVCLVAIRSALMQAQRVVAFAGAGIVAGSDPEGEWAETHDKFESISAHLVLSPDGASQ